MKLYNVALEISSIGRVRGKTNERNPNECPEMHPSLEHSVNRTSYTRLLSPKFPIEILSHLEFKTKTRELDLSVLLNDRYSLLLGMLSL